MLAGTKLRPVFVKVFILNLVFISAAREEDKIEKHFLLL